MTISSPLDIPGLVAWYSADAVTGLVDGDQMTTWQDLSGNNNHATGAAGGSGIKPKWRTGVTPGAGPAVQFTSAGSNFGGPSTGDGYFDLPANLMGSAAAGEVLVTVKQDSTASQNGLWWIQTESGYSGSHYPFSGEVAEGFGRNGGQRKFTPTKPISEWRRYNVFSEPGLTQAFLDGEQEMSSTQGQVSWPADPRLGATKSFGQVDLKFKGWIADFVIFNRKLTGTERIDLDTWANSQLTGQSEEPPATAAAYVTTVRAEALSSRTALSANAIKVAAEAMSTRAENPARVSSVRLETLTTVGYTVSNFDKTTTILMKHSDGEWRPLLIAGAD